MQEIWKDIKEYENLYQVSNKGRIRKWKIIKQSNTNNGYKCVNLIKNERYVMKKIHRLVAEAFIPNYENKPLINHKNGIKTDNRIENLEWCTSQENVIHALTNNRKLREKKEKRKRLNYDNTKVNQYDKKYNLIKQWGSIREASEMCNIDIGNMSKCCRGKRNTTGGYIWRIVD